MTKKIYKIQGMDCPSCAMVVESDLEDAGFAAKCNFTNETLEVELESKEHETVVHETVQKSGYKLLV